MASESHQIEIKEFEENKSNEESDKKKKEQPTPKVSPRKMFSLATRFEVFLIILGSLGAIAHGLSVPLFTVIFGDAIDSFNIPPDEVKDELFKVGLNFIYVGVLSAVGSFFQYSCFKWSSYKQVNRLREAFLQGALRQDIEYYDKNSSGALVSHMAGDTVLFQEAIGDKFGLLIQFFTTFIGGFTIGFVKGWKLSLVIIAVSPLIVATGAWMMHVMVSYTTKGQEAYAAAGSIATESFASIRTIASFCAENIIIERYVKNLRVATKFGIKSAFAIGAGFGSNTFSVYIMFAVALWYGGRLIVTDDGFTGGEVVAVFFSVFVGAMYLGQSSTSVEAFTKGQGAAHKLFEVIERQPLIDSSSYEGERPDKVKGNITFKNVSFSYPTRLESSILNDIMIKIKAGQTVALVGPSGSGKSSIINLIQRFYDPQGGEILLDKKNLKTLNVKWLRQQIGVVGQEPVLFAGTIAENIRYGKPDATMEEIIEACKASNAHNFISEFPQGYETFVGEKGAQLSGGQKQRVAIARAIIKNPKILLLDEATSALDTESERIVQEALDSVMQGRTTVVIAHRLSTIRHADVIIVISHGKVVEKGKHDDLMENNGLYAELVRLQGGEAPKERGKITDKKSSQKDSTEQSNEKEGTTKKEKEEEDPDKIHKVPLLRLFALNKPETPWLVIGAIASIGFGISNPIFSILFVELINAFFKPVDEVEDAVLPWVIGFIALAVGMLIILVIQSGFFGIAGEKLVQRVRVISFKAIIRKNIGWFDDEKHSSGLLASRLATDATLISGLVGSRVGMVVANIAAVVFGLGLAFYFSWKLTLVILATSPMMAFSTFLESVTFASSSVDETTEADQIASESITNIRTVATFTVEDRVSTKYHQVLARPTTKRLKRSLLSGVLMATGEFSMYVAYFINFYYGGVLIENGEIDFLIMMRVFIAILMSAMAISQNAAFGPDIKKGRIAAAHVFKIVDEVPEIDSFSQTGNTLKELHGDIEFCDAVFRYPTRPDVPVLNGINLKISAGKVTALVGASGCGKSSMVSLIERFYDLNEGKITLDDTPVRELNIGWLRQQIGMVGQEPVLFAGTIAENIRYGKPDATMEEIIEACKSSNAHNFISEFPQGYETFVGEKGAQLSGGQKQRVAIARAIIKNPKILLLDEATSALDTESERIVQEALDSVMQGRTTVVIAHRLSTIRHADVIIVISHGKVVEKGKHDELMENNGLYAELVRLQGGEAPKERGKITDKKSSQKDSTEQSNEKEGTTKKEKEEEDPDKIHKVPLLRLFALNKPETPWLVIGAIASIGFGISNPIFSILFVELINAFFKPVDEVEDAVLPWVIGFIALAVGMLIILVIQSGFFGIAGEKLVQRVRVISFKAIIRKNIGWFDDEKHSSGLLASRLATDATLISGLVGSRVGMVVANIAAVVFGLGLAFYFSWKLTLVILATSPMMAFSTFLESVTFASSSVDETTEADQIASESITNIRTVATFTVEDRVSTKYHQVLARPTTKRLKRSLLSGVLMATGEFSMYVAYFINFYYGGVLIENGEIDFLIMMRVFIAILMSAMAISQNAAFGPDIKKGRIAAAHVFKIVDEVPEIDSFSQTGNTLKELHGDIEFCDAVFRYPTRPDVPVLNGINLKISAGKVTALVGASGCGKSSMVSLIERFYDLNEGKITLDDTPVRELNIGWLRQQIGMVGQEPVLFAGTIAENIRYGKPDATMEEIIEACKASNAHNFISEFPQGYETFVGEKGIQLSGGQKQRVAIARAIIKNPKILLLDEATSALDTESERIVQEALDRVMQGRTTIIIAHRLSTIRHANTIAVIEKGKVVEQGNHEELMALNGFYHKLITGGTQ